MKPRTVSQEELQFQDWLLDAADYGLVEDFKDQPETFELVPKATIRVSDKKSKTLLQPLRYTPDFRVKLTTLGHLEISPEIDILMTFRTKDDGP